MWEIHPKIVRWGFLAATVPALLLVPTLTQSEAPQGVDGLHEPVYRVTKQDGLTRTPSEIASTDGANKPNGDVVEQGHPLDPALAMAHESLAQIQQQIDDYSCVLIKRERIGDRLGDHEFMAAKIRSGKRDPESKQVMVPFSVYLKFLKPEGIKGREVIYVEGINNGNMMVHEAGWKGKVAGTLSLDPQGRLAMMGQRYPITEIGLETLCRRLIERATRDRALGDCDVRIQPATINKRQCTRIQVTHPKQLPHLDFFLARVFVDDELKVPVRYEAYDWPSDGSGNVSEEDLIEEYTYVNLKVNNGLTNRDFDPNNPEYGMK